MKAITKKQFRILLTLSIMAMIASVIAAGIADVWLLPQPLRDYQQAQSAVHPKVSDLVISLLGIPGVIAGIISIVGLYRFWPAARWLSVSAWSYALVWMAISPGPVIENAVSAAFSQCSTLLTGVVLAIIYFSPAADWFQKKNISSLSLSVV